MRPFIFKPNPAKKTPRRLIFNTDGDLPPLIGESKRPTTMRSCGHRECRWPYGNPGADMVMCGRRTDLMEPYCVDHLRVAYPHGKPGVSA